MSPDLTCIDLRAGIASATGVMEIAKQLQLLGMASGEMVWSWDAASDQLMGNALLTGALGAVPPPREEAVGWAIARLHVDDRQRVIQEITGAIHDPAIDLLAIECRFCRCDGSYIALEARISFERDALGAPSRAVGAFRDITAQRKTENAQERFSRIVETTSDFVGMVDVNGNVLYMNRAGRELLGWPLDASLAGRQLSEAHPAWANEIVLHDAIPSAIREGRWSGETALLAQDGSEIPVSQVLISHCTRDGTVEFISTIMRDISERKREEVTRIEWANRYDAAIRASGQLLFDWNSFTNEITYAGDIERMLGYTMREMAGGLDRFRQCIHPDDLTAFDSEVARVTATRDPFRLGFRVLRKDHAEIAVDAKGYFFVDRQGRIGRMVGFLADVTVQKEAQEQLALAHDNLEMRVAERTAELARTYIVIEDRALQQESVAHLGQRALAGAQLEDLFNEAAAIVRKTLKVDLCAVLELSPDQLSLIVRGAAGWCTELMGSRVPIGTESQSGYTLLVGEPVIVEDMAQETRFGISKVVRESGAVSGISVIVQAGNKPMGVLTAMTLQRRGFSVDDVNFLRSIANVLTAAIDRRSAEESIRLAQAQAETANRAKSEFLSRMSHELRTPLNAILGFTQLLEIDTPTAEQTESISHISRAGQHLLSLINEVLDIARVDAGRFALTLEPVELAEFVSSSVELIRPVAERHKIELVLEPIEPGLQVEADRARFKQVLLNLFSNAVKYNRPAGRVVVTCSAASQERVRISVRDTGPGIAPDKMTRLFVPFERLGAESTQIEGTGIGLALSQRIVTALGGQLGVESVVDEGSTFWMELKRVHPTALSPALTVDRGLAGPPNCAQPEKVFTILYVEDQDLNLRLVERLFATRPEYRLLPAMQGGLALDLAREHQPELILLDLNLPDMSGEVVLRRLKEDPAVSAIPVITVSADAMGDRIERLLALGATGYLTKPFLVSEFFQVIDGVLMPS
jgi:PAS domain S-box-containing protein